MNRKTQIAKRVFVASCIFFALLLLLVAFLYIPQHGTAFNEGGALLFAAPLLLGAIASPFVLGALMFSGIYWFVNKNKSN